MNDQIKKEDYRLENFGKKTGNEMDDLLDKTKKKKVR